jgi:hypothetical protein
MLVFPCNNFVTCKESKYHTILLKHVFQQSFIAIKNSCTSANIEHLTLIIVSLVHDNILVIKKVLIYRDKWRQIYDAINTLENNTMMMDGLILVL